MRSFFKIFFACLLALVVFGLLAVFFIVVFVSGWTSKNIPHIESNSVLVLDLGQHYMEQAQENYLSVLQSDDEQDIPGLYDVVRLLHKAEKDKNISGVYIVANSNPNGFAASSELRKALSDFKKSGKFVLAHGDVISQRAYGIASIADKVYLNPTGMLEWVGFNVEFAFLKGTLEKLDIEPQVFYAGKFKSATEPFRTDEMTEENELQTTVWLNDLYHDFLSNVAVARKLDTGTLHQLANEGRIQNARDALDNKLVDGLKYNDELNDDLRQRLGLDKYERINFVTINSYLAAGKFVRRTGGKIALIYAEGDIIDGKADIGVIAADHFRELIRKARLDKTIEAIVFRINSGGGSSLASENIWRELSLAKQEKPVVVSFGDVAASGGYYIGCSADSIFAEPTSITGSIGVFGIIPNMQAFFKNKLGISFDGVKTGPYADAGAIYRPMTEEEKKMVQAQIDLIYGQFKQRVASGRKKDEAFVDSIAQGRVWTGVRAKDIGLIDRFGGLEEAVQCAARMARLSEYQLREYPTREKFFDRLFGKSNPLGYMTKMKQEMGEENYKIYQELKKVKEMSNQAQTRLPFQFFIR